MGKWSSREGCTKSLDSTGEHVRPYQGATTFPIRLPCVRSPSLFPWTEVYQDGRGRRVDTRKDSSFYSYVL